MSEVNVDQIRHDALVAIEKLAEQCRREKERGQFDFSRAETLRAENEKLRGELAEENRLHREACEHVRHLHADLAAVAERTAREQRTRCAEYALWGGGPAGLGEQERWSQFIKGTPLVTDAPSKPKTGWELAEEKRWADGQPGTPPPESPAEPRLRPCDSPGCGGHHE